MKNEVYVLTVTEETWGGDEMYNISHERFIGVFKTESDARTELERVIENIRNNDILHATEFEKIGRRIFDEVEVIQFKSGNLKVKDQYYITKQEL